MDSFKPTRASPNMTAKPLVKFDIANMTAISTASSNASAALSGLSNEDILLIDEIIERAPSTATTFLTVFKAYNEVLQEKGMDPSTDIVYYRMLLKLGVIKGKDWGEKWKTVKQQFGYDSFASTSSVQSTLGPPIAATRFHHNASKHRFARAERDTSTPEADSITVHSHQGSADVDGTNMQTPRHLLASNSVGNVLRLTLRPSINQEPPAPTRLVQTTRRTRIDQTISSISSEQNTLLSSTPPSYNATTADTPKPVPSVSHLSRITQRVPQRPDVVPRVSVINEEEAWSRVKVAQDEKEADRFRKERLLETCWQVWRDGLEWIDSTGRQLDLARDHILKKTYLERWRAASAKKLAEQESVAKIADNYFIRRIWNVWKRNLKEKKLVRWKNDMRKKMVTIKEKRNTRLKADAWAKWRQLWQSHLSGQRYSTRLCIKLFSWWKRRLHEFDRLEIKADDFIRRRESSLTVDLWDFWRRRTALAEKEQQFSIRADDRIKSATWKSWRSQMHNHHAADSFYDVVLTRTFFRLWQTAKLRIIVSEQKADKYRARQQGVLVRAVARVWVARERSSLLERVRTSRILHFAWDIWRKRQRSLRDLEERAKTFSLTSRRVLLRDTVQHWRQLIAMRQNLMQFAIMYHNSQMYFRVLQYWRIMLRLKLRMLKQARIARRYLVLRRAWKHWKEEVAHKKREKFLDTFRINMQRRVFQAWREHRLRNQYYEHATRKIQKERDLRVLADSLKIWTTRVIDLKLREIEASENYDHTILVTAFNKWKAIQSRHVEDLSLMQSYHDIKREETMRRVFHRWLTAAREARHRRLVLQQCEEQFKQKIMQTAWGVWRERAKSIYLKPLEENIALQFQQNLLFHAFGIWLNKTESIPAIRFYNSRMKERYWKVWRSLMPRAVQAKQARQMDIKSTLGKALDKWVKTYRTKMALKAVARARYLRLPTGPRPTLPDASSTSIIDSNKSSYSRSSEKLIEPAKAATRQPHLLVPTALSRWGSRPVSRDAKSSASPSRTEDDRKSDIAQSDRVRSNLWSELRQQQQISRFNINRPRSVGG